MTIRLASGDSVTGSVLIGAEGLWSNVRKQVVNDARRESPNIPAIAR
jgi:2-polyprenyl-6-methoxyphenol hydroxylase-like FAD-dependent oxidoreductase